MLNQLANIWLLNLFVKQRSLRLQWITILNTKLDLSENSHFRSISRIFREQQTDYKRIIILSAFKSIIIFIRQYENCMKKMNTNMLLIYQRSLFLLRI